MPDVGLLTSSPFSFQNSNWKERERKRMKWRREEEPEGAREEKVNKQKVDVHKQSAYTTEMHA